MNWWERNSFSNWRIDLWYDVHKILDPTTIVAILVILSCLLLFLFWRRR